VPSGSEHAIHRFDIGVHLKSIVHLYVGESLIIHNTDINFISIKIENITPFFNTVPLLFNVLLPSLHKLLYVLSKKVFG